MASELTGPAKGLAGATIVFDLDGTLVDTAPDIVPTLNAVLEAEGLPPLPYAEARLLIGGGGRALMERGFVKAGVTLSDVRLAELTDRFMPAYVARIAQASRPYRGAVEALATLKAGGAKLVVGTNKRTDQAKALLSELGLADFFVAIVGPDAAGARKPDPRHLLATIQAAGGDPARAVLVGDSPYDAETARAAAVPLILVSFGYTEVPAKDLGPDVLIDHFDELPDACLRLLDACGA